jgi:hypothetical protein
MKKLDTIWVRNNGKEPFTDRYDGEDFEIAPGGVCEMLVSCAELCLGFGENDKSRCLRRAGWAYTSDRFEEAVARLNKFSFHMTEREALEHDPSKTISSSAPADDETPAAAPVVAGGVAHKGTTAKINPLQKLASANAPAG